MGLTRTQQFERQRLVQKKDDGALDVLRPDKLARLR
jgi:hypothetical protein